MKPPAYAEAYPRFDIVQAKARTEKELEICEFADDRGLVFGLARVAAANQTHVTLEYAVQLPFFSLTFSAVELELVVTPNGVDPNRTVVLCPECRKRRSVLVLKGAWKCSQCHKLMNRSQCMTTNTRLFEKKNALQLKLRHGRPKGMHHLTFTALKASRLELSKKLAPSCLHDPNDSCWFILRSTWRAEKAGDEWWFSGPKDGESY